MNIVGKKTDIPMVQWTTPEEYFFSTAKSNQSLGALEQRGLYNRAMVGIRIENLPVENIMAMHQYFVELDAKAQRREVTFHLFLGPVYNLFRKIFVTIPLAERGNCARWTSKGLEKAGVVTHASIWPKSVWVNIFENCNRTAAKSEDNINVVSYHRIKHAKLSYGIDAISIGAVAPLQSLRSISYWNLDRFAAAVVEVPPGTFEAKITLQKEHDHPSFLRNILNSRPFIFLSVIITGHILFKYNARFNTAAFQWWTRKKMNVQRQYHVRRNQAKDLFTKQDKK